MRTVRRLRLRCLLFTTTPVVLPSVLAHHVETLSPPTKHTLLHVTQAGLGLNMLRWRCRESNPGPQRLHLEGFTTILYIAQNHEFNAAMIPHK